MLGRKIGWLGRPGIWKHIPSYLPLWVRRRKVLILSTRKEGVTSQTLFSFSFSFSLSGGVLKTACDSIGDGNLTSQRKIREEFEECQKE